MDFILDFVIVLGIGVNILILLALWNKNQQRSSKNILIVIFLSLLSIYVHAYASLHAIQFLFESFFAFDFAALWLIGPLLMFYVRSVFEKQFRIRKSDLIHFLPLLVVMVTVGFPYSLGFYFHEFRFDYLHYLHDNQDAGVISRGVHLLGYIVYSFILFIKLSATDMANTLGIKENNSWIKSLLIGCLIFSSIDFVLIWAEFLSGGLPFNSGYITVFAMIGFSTYLGFHGVRHTQVLLPDYLSHVSLSSDVKEPSIAPSHVHIKNAELFQLEFENKLKEEQYYLDEDLTLTKLAGHFGVTDKWISSLLNKYIGMSFYDYINALRLAEVKRRLRCADYADYKIVAVAYDCGFSSKSSFNRIFKKETGLTPSEFRNSIHGELKLESRRPTASIETI